MKAILSCTFCNGKLEQRGSFSRCLACRLLFTSAGHVMSWPKIDPRCKARRQLPSRLDGIISAISCNICSTESNSPCPRSDCVGKRAAAERIRLLFDYVASTASDLKEHGDCGGPYGAGGKGACSMCSAASILERALRGEP